MTAETIDLSDWDFWARPLHEREQAFAYLRSLPEPTFYAEPENPVVPQGPGYYALVTRADIIEASRRPEDFCSGQSAISIPDMPAEFSEYFGSMINMDDPRHAKIRRIVSRAFTPPMLAKVEDDVRRAASAIVDDVLATGPCDFVTDVAARLPLQIICDMMGIPRPRTTRRSSTTPTSSWAASTPSSSPRRLRRDRGEAADRGAGAAGPGQDLARHRRENPADDLISALVNANIDGESLTDQELGSFFILLRRAVTRDTELNGRQYSEGDKLLLYYWSANRDETVFADPYAFDILRDPNPHVGFGGPGPHFCLGANLARREITVMFRELFRRIPTIHSTAPPSASCPTSSTESSTSPAPGSRPHSAIPRPSDGRSLPGMNPFLGEEGAGRAVGAQVGGVDDDGGALARGPESGVGVQVGRAVARIHRVDLEG